MYGYVNSQPVFYVDPTGMATSIPYPVTGLLPTVGGYPFGPAGMPPMTPEQARICGEAAIAGGGGFLLGGGFGQAAGAVICYCLGKGVNALPDDAEMPEAWQPTPTPPQKEDPPPPTYTWPGGWQSGEPILVGPIPGFPVQ